MGADLHDAPFFEKDDFIRKPDCIEPMRDDNPCMLSDIRQECLLEKTLGLVIQCRGGLIKDEDLRAAQDGARNADPLPLTTGKTHTAIANARLVSIFQMHDKVVRLRNARSCFHLFRCNPRQPEDYIIIYCIIEKDDILIHNSKQPP